MTAPFDDFEDAPPLILRWVHPSWVLYDTEARRALSTHRTLLLAEAAQIAEAYDREQSS